MSKRCYYFVEGECEETLINSLKKDPAKIIPGRVKVWNVIDKALPDSILRTIQPGSIVVFVFDTDVQRTGNLLKNVQQVKRYAGKVILVILPQVMNLEDELIRCTDVKNITELTKSKSRSDFKRDFCQHTDCRQALSMHKFDIGKIWTQPLPDGFDIFAVYANNRNQIMVKTGK